MKHWLLFILLLIFTLSFICCTNLNISETEKENSDILEKAKYIKISKEEAHDMMTSDGVIILDVRTQAEFDEGHIINAILLPYDEIDVKAENIIPDKNKTILIYCRTGRRSEIAARELIDMGYTKVFDFGGIVDWEYEIIKPIDFTATIKINIEMPEFDFRLEGKEKKYLSFEYIDISKLTISDKNGSFKQEFTNLSTEIWASENKNNMYGLAFDDWNFDGYLDVSLWQEVGGTMRNSPHYYWLWDNKAGLYVENTQLFEISDYSTISIVPNKNQITNFMHIGPEGDSIGYWEYIKDEYIWVKSKSIEWLNDDEYIYHVIIEEFIDGEMIVTKDYFSNDYDEVYEN